MPLWFKRTIQPSLSCSFSPPSVLARGHRPGLPPCEKVGSFHSTGKRRRRDDIPSRQAQPLSGYYADLLSSPLPTQSSPSSSSPPPPRHDRPAALAATVLPATKEERARVVFGTRLAGAGYQRGGSNTPDATWRTINGVPVPPRPDEPDNCCMSGCVHCVWDDYRDEVESWALRLREAQQAKVTGVGGGYVGSAGVDGKEGMSRGEVMEASKSMDDDGGGSETNWDGGEVGELFSGIPVGIREFMRTEKRLRDRHRKERQLPGP